MKIRGSKPFQALLTALCVALVSFSGATRAADSSAPIVIPTHNWSSQVVMAYVIGGIFEHMGNNVEYVKADTQACLLYTSEAADE